MARSALYVRVSTGSQDEHGYSVDGQLAELHQNAGREGLEVVSEVVDRGEKRWTLERPGVHELRRLAAAGEIDEVWAWRWDRFGQSPWPEVLQVELEEHGVTLRSLDDGGEGEDAELLRGLRSLLAKKEQTTRTARIIMGRRSKAKRGQLFGTGPKPRYGFRHVRNDRGRVVGYEVDPETMAVVRRVFDALASGESRWAVQKSLEEDGIPAPGGGAYWHSSTLRNMVQEDTYRPHTSDELADALSPEVRAGLDPERPYGLAWQGRRTTKGSPMSGASVRYGRGKTRKIRWTPKEEWIAVPVDLTGSGLSRETVERARAAVSGKSKPSAAGDRFWELSGGVLRCAGCGRVMRSYRRKSRRGGYLYYYRCQPASPAARRECPNRKSHTAEELENRAARILYDSFDPEGEMMARLYEKYTAEKAKIGTGDAERRAALLKQLEKIEKKREGYWELAAEGDMPRDAMRAKIVDLEEEKSEIEAELEYTRDAAARLQRLERLHADMKELYEIFDQYPHQIHASEGTTRYHDDGENVSIEEPPEARAKRYRGMGISFTVDGDGTLRADWEVNHVPNQTQIFVCATSGEDRCGEKGGGELLDRFREEVGRRGFSPSAVLRNACARRHHEGPVVFVYPDDVWYTEVSPGEVPEIVERHLVRERVET